MADSPTCHRDVIELWPSIADFALDLGLPYGTAKAMRRRGSIPADSWVNVVRAAESREIPGITFELLAHLAAAKRTSTQPSPEVSPS